MTLQLAASDRFVLERPLGVAARQQSLTVNVGDTDSVNYRVRMISLGDVTLAAVTAGGARDVLERTVNVKVCVYKSPPL